MPNVSAPAREIFLSALERATPSERADFLNQACQGDADLRQQVEALLRVHHEPDSLLDQQRINLRAPLDLAELSAITIDQPATSVGATIGPYKLVEQIGEGGMGLVFMAEQQRPVRRLVALKLVKPGMDSRQVIARFEAERQALAMMDHPNIARVLDAGTTDTGHPYFVMELVRGIPLNEFCDQKRLTVRQRLELFIQVCHAVQHAHQKGVIHRDLKPTNVLVTMHDAVAVPKVIDFGIAKALGQQLTEHTLITGFAQMIGTPLYMSPEQADMNQFGVDTRSDVYSLGVMLYELLTGTTPFDKQTLTKAGFDELRRVLRELEPPRPSARVSTLEAKALSTVSNRRSTDPRRITTALRGELDWIVMQALQKDRSERYESVSSLAADIRRYLADEPVQAGPPTVAYRLRKFVRRNHSRVVVSGLTATLLAVVAIGCVLAYSGRVANQRQIVQHVQQSVAAAKTAIEAGDLTLADKRVAEAKGRLGDHGAALSVTAADVEKLTAELVTRRVDQERFDKFVRLTREAQDEMSYSSDPIGARLAREALELYGIVTADDWQARLERSYLQAEQKRQVHEIAYVTLVSYADYGIRWRTKRSKPGSPPLPTVKQCLALLERAQAFHQPTRAFWFVHWEAQKLLKNKQAAQESQRQFETAVATSAWDHFLIGHSAGWRGDIDEAIRSYQAALRLEPDHYNSLFFLGVRIGVHKSDRTLEAISYLTGASALRPDKVAPYVNRAECFEKLGRFEEAEADFTAAIARLDDSAAIARLDDSAATARADRDEVRLAIYQMRHAFYVRLGRTKEARQDLDRLVLFAEDVLQNRRSNLGIDHDATVDWTLKLAATCFNAGRFDRALELYEPLVAMSSSKRGRDHPTTIGYLARVGQIHAAAGRHNQAIAILEDVRQRGATGSGDLPPELDWVLHELTYRYTQAGQYDQAIATGTQSLDLVRRRYDPHHDSCYVSLQLLATAYLRASQKESAIPITDEFLQAVQKSGQKNAKALTALNNLAVEYMNAELLETALPLLQQAYESRRTLLGSAHRDTLTTLNNFATANYRRGKYDQAESLFRKQLGLLREVRGAEHPETLNATAALGRTLIHLGNTTEAETLLRECVATCERTMPDDWLTFNRKSVLGEALLGQACAMQSLDSLDAHKLLAESESQLLAGYQGLAQREGNLTAYQRRFLSQALQRLVELYIVWNRPEEAAKWRALLPSEEPMPSEPNN